MNKILIAIATLVFAVGAMLTPTAPAQAGWKGRLAVGLAIGAIGAMSHHHRYEKRRWRKERYQAHRKAKKKVYTSKKSTASPKKVAKAEPASLPEQKVIDAAVENENSSIATVALPAPEATATDTSALTTDQAAETVKVAVENPETATITEPQSAGKASKLDCRKFFPAVGMTLSVSCE
jgi:hypothetical protein